jgi:hypothetical protein
MKTTINKTYIEGLLYEYDLAIKESGALSQAPGTVYIAGSISVATDDNITNIVTINYGYVTEKTKKGESNQTFINLKNILDGKIGSVMKNGKDNAAKLRVNSTIGVNDFYTENRSTNEIELVSAKRNDGGFIHFIDAFGSPENQRSTFECDMIITNAYRKEADEERQIPEKVIVKGATFDFKGALLPIELSATDPAAMSYFESLGASASEPVFTKVWGKQVSEVVIKTITQESAFGPDSVREVKNTRKDFVITGAAKEPYIWDDESTITAAELQSAAAARETYLATVKQRYLDYKESKKTNSVASAIPKNATVASEFNF